MLNLLVLRVTDIEISKKFYNLLGVEFEEHQHGKGLRHFAAELGGVTFELYPCTEEYPLSSSTRIGFRVNDMKKVLKQLHVNGIEPLLEPKQTEWGIRTVIEDPDKHRVELVQESSTE